MSGPALWAGPQNLPFIPHILSSSGLTALGGSLARRCSALPTCNSQKKKKKTALPTCNSPRPPYHAPAQTAILPQPSSQCRQASWAPPWQGRQPPSGRCRRAGCLLGAVASQHAHQPVPLGRSCLLLPWLAPGHHPPTGGPPVTPSCPFCQPVCQPLPLYFAPPGLACYSVSISGPELHLTPTFVSPVQARQLHCVWNGSQVGTLVAISWGRCTLGSVRCQSAAMHINLSTVLHPVRTNLMP